MKIGCPKEIKPQEFRVGITPNAAREAVNEGDRSQTERKNGQRAAEHGREDAQRLTAVYFG